MNTLATAFNENGIAYEEIDGGAITSAFQTNISNDEEKVFGFFALPMKSVFGDDFIRFTIVPFVNQSPGGFSSEVYSLVGEANHQLLGLKFAFDDDGDLELACDVRVEGLNGATLKYIIQLLADHAGVYFPLLEKITSG